MQTHSALVELARICARQAHFTADREVARELWRMALEYQHKAAALDNGELPDVGPAPAWLNEKSPTQVPPNERGRLMARRRD